MTPSSWQTRKTRNQSSIPISCKRCCLDLFFISIQQPCVRELFHRHNAYTKFGIQLIHRHFTLDDQFILVEDCAVTSPFPLPAADQFPSDRIFGKSWYYNHDGTLEPYEYRITLDEADQTAVPANLGDFAEFTSELYNLLTEHHLVPLLGLSALGPEGLQPPGDSTLLEKTYKDRNIFMRRPNEEIQKHRKEFQTSLWRFVPNQYESGIQSTGQLLCFSDCFCSRST